MREWYVLKTKPKMEQQVSCLLASRQAEHYLPLVSGYRNRSRREPLFPGYLFCRIEIPSILWVETRSLPGIAYVLGAGGTPSPVPPALIDMVQNRVQEETGNTTRSRFKSGQRVQIARGPFQGFEAVFDRKLSPSGRSRVFIHLLRQIVPLELQESQLR